MNRFKPILLSLLFLVASTFGQNKTVEDYIKLANLSLLFKNYTGAIQNYAKAIEIDPKSTSTYFAKGKAELELKKYEDALSDFAKVIELGIKTGEAYHYRGRAKFHLKDKTGACADWQIGSDLGYADSKVLLARHCK